MKLLGSHKNVVSMVGCCTLENEMFLVIEYVPCGDLLTWLRRGRKKVKKGRKLITTCFRVLKGYPPKFFLSLYSCKPYCLSKFKLKKSSSLPNYYLLEQLKINIYSNFHFEKGLASLLYNALEFLRFWVTYHLYGALKSCHVD